MYSSPHLQHSLDHHPHFIHLPAISSSLGLPSASHVIVDHLGWERTLGLLSPTIKLWVLCIL